ncbi:MAG: Maf family protein [Oscillospiraceae bacterium]|nr:Maf family protein [Oscillospiraceae bacterium]
MGRIVLASRSPRRQELLRRIGLDNFAIAVPDVDEWYPEGLSPRRTVEYISAEKSAAAANMAAPEDIVITADTMVFLGDERLGKPKDEDEAFLFLSSLSGKKHSVCTGVTVSQGNRILTDSVATDVYFRELLPEEIRAYIKTGEPMDKAGAYGVQGRGALFVERIDGDFFNVMGMPLMKLGEMLKKFGVDVFR